MTAASSRPACLGGPPACASDIRAITRWPVLGDAEKSAIGRILDHGDISTHPVIRELEDDYRRFVGVEHALAHANGTAALLAAFWAIDLQPGDEVLVPSATFWASVLPMLWLGAIPVFCESEPVRMGLDPADLRSKITPRTRAIVVVHLWGMPSRMTEISAIAREFGLRVIEDASHAHGAFWRDRPCGSLGDVGVFSLQGSKLAPAGEGGILLCRDRELWERAVCLGDITRILELESPARRFAATSFGIKTRIAPVSAAIARVQLEKLAASNERRAEALTYLSAGLEELGIRTFLPPPHVRRVYFEYLVHLDPATSPLSPDLVLRALEHEGCEVRRPRYPLLHQQPFFVEGAFARVARLPPDRPVPNYAQVSLPRTERMNGEMIKLPTFQYLDAEIIDGYLDAFRKVWRNADAIAERFAA